MNNEVTKCRVCGSIELEYNEDTYRNVCLRCNAMQEMTDIGVTATEKTPGVNFRGLQKVRAPVKRKKSSKADLKTHIMEMKPFRLEDMFHWLFERQIQSMRTYVKDFDRFESYCKIMWERYMECSGSGFNIKIKSADDIRLKKYPLGWGTPLDPNKVEETLNIVPREYYKLRREELNEKIEENDDIENDVDKSDTSFIKFKRNAKKLKIEKMVKAKLNETVEDIKESNEDMDDDREGLIKLEEDVPKSEPKQEIIYSSSDEEESELSDEADESYINMHTFEGKDKNTVRIMRKKRECHVRYFGGRVKTHQLLMENNILLLFFAMYLSMTGSDQCCCLLDIMRLTKRGVIPFLKVGRVLPVDRFYIPHSVFQSIILRDVMPTFNDMKHYGFYLAETLDLEVLYRPNMSPLITRLIHDNNLPKTLITVVDLLRDTVDDKLNKYYKLKGRERLFAIHGKWVRFKLHGQHVLFPELSGLAYIYLALRMMMRLDNEFERRVSELAREFNDSDESDGGQRLFVWLDWLKQQHRPKTISTAKTWKDLDHVRSAKDFFEEDEYDDVTLYESVASGSENKLMNSCGRFVHPYKKGTHESVIRAMCAPLESAGRRYEQGASSSQPPVAVVKDFRDSSIDYLIDVTTFQERLQPTPTDDDHGARLVQAVSPNRLLLFPVTPEHVKYSRGVFAELLSHTTTTNGEHCLLDILTARTGISNYELLKTAQSLTLIISSKK